MNATTWSSWRRRLAGRQCLCVAVALLMLLPCSLSSAAIFELDFDTDPEDLGVEFFGTAEWREFEGNPPSGGYLNVTDALNSQRGAIVFPDLENGADLTSVFISADLRVGGGTARPADGFSFNFARPDDPVLDDGEDWASSPTGEANLPEEGTTTGLAIGFDEWFSGGDDVVGMSIRIDDELVDQFEFPVLNGELEDEDSLQTGPSGLFDDELDLLGWAPLKIRLDSSNNLEVTYKGVEVFNQMIDYAPGPGLLVFGGRTGGANAYHHIDNITICSGADTPTSIDGTCGEGGAHLQAGDADQDFDVDQLDLVQVQVGGKYLTGQAATWGEGDFDAAPGGTQGNPPIGNGFFDQVDVIAILTAGKYLTGPYAALAPGGTEGDEQTSLVYDPSTGNLSVDAPASTQLTSIFVTSAGNQFIGDKPPVLDGPFDSFAADNIFKSTIGSSFGDIDFGAVLPASLSEADVLADLTASGSLDGGGGLGDVDLVYVPEPNCLTLLIVGALAYLGCIVRRSRN